MAEILRLNAYLRKRFGIKVYKLALNGGMNCPNRDGTLGTGGCIFCSEGGSGDFAASFLLPVSEQIQQAKQFISSKLSNQPAGYIAYFQAYTNTYAPVEYLRKIFYEAIDPPDIIALSVGTRPDCIGPDVLELLRELNTVKPVFVELGLQTIHPETARFIRRGYDLEVFDECVGKLHAISVETVVHLILGLPGETPEDMTASVRYISRLPVSGVKLQLLHILKNTDLAIHYEKHPEEIPVLSLEEYTRILGECIEHLRPDIVIHRFTGDGPKSQLLAPMWSADKKRVLNYINRYFNEHNIIQGRKYTDYGN